MIVRVVGNVDTDRERQPPSLDGEDLSAIVEREWLRDSRENVNARRQPNQIPMHLAGSLCVPNDDFLDAYLDDPLWCEAHNAI